MDRIDLFRIFARVVACGHFTQAAQTLHLPRSTVSTSIRTLETLLGTRLIHRTTRRMALTEDGRMFHDRCLRLLQEYDEAETLFRRGAAPLHGRLRINVPARLGRLVIAPALPDFLGRYPGIALDMGSTDRAVDLVWEGVDCAVRVGVLEDSGLIARPVGQLTLVNCASPDYLARHGIPRETAELARHVAVGYTAPATGRTEEWEVAGRDGVRLMALPSRVTVNCAESYIACCLAGLGLIQVPLYDVRAHLDTGALVEVLPDARAAPMPVHLVFPHRGPRTRRLAVFADWLTSLLAARVIDAPDSGPTRPPVADGG
ncbi:LysR family transcriptional regulator [Gluconacetobacter azotocaptans]|uniref:LysR family transcriptional regulator n=1 Tax=Gluconacetobacter azotocaptans TaxID=142834 RepID=A0A7W4JPZ0_9PROT|nr:LysR family transcriptional regulator [Gluconacetobacter azotocaptans]MBB2188615.1 LysR family transcriptional regulator [Gluconacetobacter azotocaptans]MBM9400319.1 LysR family transcriptional regulator [Gluconacetobacter azotocaptans]GBQ35347.1 LysR family transcriptional regulator [Gluconacetobacter azotocaptans DSM 13594]